MYLGVLSCVFLQSFSMRCITAQQKEHIHSYKDFWLLSVSERMWPRGKAGGAGYWVPHWGCGHTNVEYSDRTCCFVNASGGDALTCSWLSVMTPGFFSCVATQFPNHYYWILSEFTIFQTRWKKRQLPMLF